MGDLNVDDEKLSQLVSDLDEMERHLRKKIARMDRLLDRVGSGWLGSTANSFKELQKSLNEDARTIRKSLILIEEAVKKSRDGFTAQELETLRAMKRISLSSQDGRLLSQADANPQPEAPRSRIHDLL